MGAWNNALIKIASNHGDYIGSHVKMSTRNGALRKMASDSGDYVGPAVRMDPWNAVLIEDGSDDGDCLHACRCRPDFIHDCQRFTGKYQFHKYGISSGSQGVKKKLVQVSHLFYLNNILSGKFSC